MSLGPDEIACAELVGSRRFRSSRRAGTIPRVGHSERIDQLAAMGEIFVCKDAGGWWAAIDSVGSDNKQADMVVGKEPFQIRWSPYGDGFLTVYPNDPDEQFIYFVVGEVPNLRIVGRVPIGYVKELDSWRETNPKTGERLNDPCWVLEQSHWLWSYFQ